MGGRTGGRIVSLVNARGGGIGLLPPRALTRLYVSGPAARSRSASSVGANALVGGSDKSIVLQPLSLEALDGRRSGTGRRRPEAAVDRRAPNLARRTTRYRCELTARIQFACCSRFCVLHPGSRMALGGCGGLARLPAVPLAQAQTIQRSRYSRCALLHGGCRADERDGPQGPAAAQQRRGLLSRPLRFLVTFRRRR